MKKRYFVLFLLLACPLVFFSCKATQKIITLDTPEELVVENQFITFKSVDNASYYNIYYDGNTFSVPANNEAEMTIDVSKIFTEAKTYEVKVQSIGSGRYRNSSYTSVFEYTRETNFGTPNLNINSQTLLWSRVEGAEHYTVRVIFPDESKGYYTYSSNNFNIGTILGNVGNYKFQVKAGSLNDNNEYSAEVNYEYHKQLETPTKLSLEYNSQEDEVYLNFIGDENSYSYLVYVNNKEYELKDNYFEAYVTNTTYENYYKLKLIPFVSELDDTFEPNGYYSVFMQARKANEDFYINSLNSNTVSISVKEVLDSPVARMTTNNNVSTLSWTGIEGASSYAIYKDYEFYISVENSVRSFNLVTSEIGNSLFSVKAEGKGLVVDSLLSNAVATTTLTAVGMPNISFMNSTISWNEVAGAEKYIVEIYNEQNNFIGVTTECSFDISSYNYGKYSAKVTVYKAGTMSKSDINTVNFTKKLAGVTNAVIGSEYAMNAVTFDNVDGAIGYAVKLNGHLVDKLFTSNKIDLTNYILTNGTFAVTIQSVGDKANNVSNSDWISVGNLTSAVKLATPEISVVNENNKFLIKFNQIENAEKYYILVNYVPIFESGANFNLDGYDITTYMVSAQRYTIMVKALAELNSNYLDSDYSKIVVPRYIQLATINSTDITVDFRDARYWLDFTTQTHAANYDIRIYNSTTETESKFNISSTPFDITSYVRAGGTYKIYVKALAIESSTYLYLSSAESGNPYTLTKDKPSLSAISNWQVAEKVPGSDSVMATWDSVDNADMYYININYTRNVGNRPFTTLIKEVTVTQNRINLADYLTKEGNYTFRIKAVSNGNYEASAFVDQSYNHTMAVDTDFKRNKVFIDGQEFSHYVTTYTQLKELIWFYYLYNDYNFYDSTMASYYKLKIMLGADISVIVSGCKDENVSFSTSATTTYTKLEAVSYQAMATYREAFYVLDNVIAMYSIPANGLTYYIYDYYDALDRDKTSTISTEESSNIFGQKQYILLQNQRRSDNYVFVIDGRDEIEVVNSEELFMAVSNNKSPVFIGDCEVAEDIYFNAREILMSICNDEMTDYDKVVAIYNWLVNNVQYSDAFYELQATKPNANSFTDATNTEIMGNCMYEYLEGVFYDEDNRLATSNGFAKAFSLMCNIEGIKAIKIAGSKNSRLHYYNKVFVDGTPNNEIDAKSWFTVDCVSSFRTEIVNSISYQVPTHQYFLVTDAYMKSELNINEIYTPTAEAKSTTSINYYANTLYSYNKEMLVVAEGGGVETKTFAGTGTLKYLTGVGTAESYVKDIMKYLVFESNGTNNCAIEMDMENSTTSLETLVNNITSTYYTEMASEFNISFRIQAKTYGNKILIMVRPR